MAGVFTENQPDFTWLMPYEEKRFTQYFMPYRELGVVKDATKDLIMNIDFVDDQGNVTQENTSGKVNFKVFATSKQEVRVILDDKEGECYNKVLTLSPEEVHHKDRHQHNRAPTHHSCSAYHASSLPSYQDISCCL